MEANEWPDHTVTYEYGSARWSWLCESMRRLELSLARSYLGCKSQMRRSAVSIPSNIAEGKGRLTDRDRAHFFSQARGSLLELETQIQIATGLHYLSTPTADSLMQLSTETGRMLNLLLQSIRPTVGR